MYHFEMLSVILNSVTAPDATQTPPPRQAPAGAATGRRPALRPECRPPASVGRGRGDGSAACLLCFVVVYFSASSLWLRLLPECRRPNVHGGGGVTGRRPGPARIPPARRDGEDPAAAAVAYHRAFRFVAMVLNSGQYIGRGGEARRVARFSFSIVIVVVVVVKCATITRPGGGGGDGGAARPTL